MLYLNGTPLNFIKYPAGEYHFRQDDNPQVSTWINLPTVTVQFEDSDDLIKLALLDDFLTQKGFNYDLLIPYFPSSRQDRVENKESHSLRVYVNFIKGLNANKVITLDPHSDVLEGMFEAGQLTCIPQEYLLYQAINTPSSNKQLVLVSPDKGAISKIKKCAKYLSNQGIPIKGIIQADKIRNYFTGEIVDTSIEILPELNAPYSFLVVDDICDGGRTFIELAKKLHEYYPNKAELSLYVTHGLFTKGKTPLYEAGYSTIYTGQTYETTS